MQEVFLIDTIIINKNEINIASDIIKGGGIVVFPTETVYGLGANALSENAVAKIFQAKKRPQDNPLIVHISSINDIENLTSDFNENAKIIAQAFMPGPITIVLKKSNIVPYCVSAGLDTVGIRFPKNDIARELITRSNTPIAAPSANISGQVSGTTFVAVKNELFGLVDAIIDGGDCEFGIESTVIDLTKEAPVILRPGSITLEMLQEKLPNTILHPSLTLDIKVDNPASPGMKYKHYSPNAKVILLYGKIENIVNKFKNNIKDEECIFMFSEYINMLPKNVYNIGSINNLNEMTHLIFSLLKKADTDGYNTIYIPAVEETGVGLSIMNRLKKSSGGARWNL
jgi:L-threonylcarbamoyladenylate synthase